MSEAGYLQLVVDSTSVSQGERALDSIARTGSRVEGRMKIDMGSIEQAMARLGQQIGRLDSTMVAQAQKAVGANQKQTRSFEELRAAIDPAFASSQKYAAVQQELARMVQTGEASQRAANIVLEQAASRYMGVATASERAEQAQREQTQSTMRSKAAYEALRASVDPVYAASKRYEAALETLDAAQKAGVVTDQQRAKTLELIENQMIATGRASTTAGGGVGKFGLVANQVGYQVQDIFVSAPMVGWFRAIAQQAPQAAGAFSLLGGSIGTLIPWIGTAIAVGAAFAPMLFDIGNEADEAEDRIDSLEAAISALGNVSQATGDQVSRYLTGAFGEVSEQVQALIDDLRDAEFSVISRKIRGEIEQSITSLNALGGAFDVFWADFANPGQTDPGYLNMIKQVIADAGLAYDEFQRLDTAVNAVFAAESVDGFIAALAAARGEAEALGGPVGTQVAQALLDAAESGGLLNRLLSAAAGTGGELAKTDMSAGITPAVAAAMELSAQLGISLQKALAIKGALNTRTSEDVFDPRDGRAGSEEFRLERIRRQMEQIDYSTSLATAEIKKFGKAGGGASKAASTSTLAALKLEIADRQKLLSLTGLERREYEAILTVQKRLGKEAAKVSAAQIEGLADQLLALEDQEAALQRITDLQGQWSEQITRTAFEGGSLSDTVKGFLKDIAYQFTHSKIVLPIVASVTSILGLDQVLLGGNLSSAVTGGGGGILGGAGNLLGLGNLFGGGGFLGGIGSGLGGVLSGGGIGSSFANLGGLVTGASSGLGAIGAALPALGIIAGVGALLSKALSREYAGTALRGTLGAEGFDGTSFDFYKGGALRSDKANYKDAPVELVAYLDAAMMGVTKSITTYADALSLDIGDALQRTGEQFTVWLNGKSQEEIIEALNSQVQTVADEMAELVLGTDEFSRSGESALDTLTRLGSSLLSVNDAMLLLNHAAFATSLAAANTASDLVDQFGGIDAMNTAISTFWQAFYTDAERNEGILRQLNAQFDRLNIAMPQSRAAYRALIEAQDLNTERGRELYAQLIGLAGAMDQVLPKVAEFTASMAGLLGQIGGQVGSLLDASRENFRISQNAAREWYRATETLRDFIRDLTNSDVSPVTASQQLGINRGRFNTAFEMAKGGDVQAAQDLPGLARALLDSELANARTAAEFRAISARVQSQVAFAAGIADLEGANQDVLTTLYEQQIEVLTNLASFLQLEGLTNEQIGQLDASIQDLARDFDGTLATFDTALGSLEDAIKEAELFSYDYLKERLRVAVDILPSANIPQYLRTLIQQAGEGITATIDFVVRSQLPAPEKWLAVNSASEHIKTIDFVLRQDVSNQTRALALATGSELRRNIRFLLTQDVDAETRRIALAGNSELSRVVNVALDMAGSDQRALMLALRGIGDYAVAVNLSFGPNMSQDIRRVVLRQSGGYAAMVEAAFTQLSGSARRVLLMQQGTYAANITGIILASVPDSIKRLLLNANTTAVRAVTIASAFASSVTPQERDLLMQQGTATLRTIQARVNPLDLSPIAVKLVNQLAMGNGSIARGIEGRLWQTNWTATDQRFLDQLATGGGHIARGIEGRLWQTGWNATDEMMLRQLGFGDGIVNRDIESDFFSTVGDVDMLRQLGLGTGTVNRDIESDFFSTVDDADMLTQLGLGSGSIARGIEGRLWQTGWTANDQRFLDQLATNGGSIARGIEGRLWQTNWSLTDDRFLTQLAAGTGAISRIINGSVNIGGLSASQQALLSSITGASTGTITLAGTYRFEPEEAFRSWYSSTTQTLIRTPMDALRASLDTLRGEFVTQRQTEAAQANQRAQAIASITGTAGAYGNQLTSNRGWAEKLVAKTRELMTRTGTRLFDAQGNAATLAINPDGTINFNGAYASGGDMRAFAAEFWGTGKLNDYMARANANIDFIEGKLDTARRQIVSLGGIPSFAGGGFTGMGARSGGLDGKGGFLSMLHPRETVIDHTKDDLGAELRALRKEVSELRQENRQLGIAVVKNTRITADVMRKADKLGMPVRNPDDGTALEVL